MREVKLKYQASIFVNAEDITPNPDSIKALIDMFSDKALIPSTFYELKGILHQKPRLRLSNSNNEWEISFGSQRIDINKHSLEPEGSNVGELHKFLIEIAGWYERILSYYPKRCKRIAFNTNSIFLDTSEDDLVNIYNRLFLPPKFYTRYLPFEWNWRSGARIPIKIKKLKETLYAITSINRIRTEMAHGKEAKNFDSLQLAFDISTTDEDSEYRFVLPHIMSYYEQSIDLFNDLNVEIKEYIYG